jgi:hypothetical protein
VSGRDELAVRAYADPTSLPSASHLGRRRRLATQHERYRLAAEEADRIHAALLRCAVQGKRRPSLDECPSADGPWPVLNGSYLVDGNVVDLFMQTINELERSTASVTLEVTGPWPPYSFAEELVAI